MAENADLDTALGWHLTANHYPPLSVELIPAAKDALANARDDDWDEPVDLRGEASYKGQPTAPTWACIESWHLDAFLAAEREEDE
jgi:hypothetical protein